MPINNQDYFLLVKQVIQFQQELIPAFEEAVNVVQPENLLSSGHPPFIAMANAIAPNKKVHQVIRDWPADLSHYPMVGWVKPSKGIIQVKLQSWFFQLHGSQQVSFHAIPDSLVSVVLKRLENNQPALLREDFVNREPYLFIDVTYLKHGKTDGVRAWSMYLYSEYGQIFRDSSISHDQHKEYLINLVKLGLLDEVPGEDEHHYLIKEKQ